MFGCFWKRRFISKMLLTLDCNRLGWPVKYTTTSGASLWLGGKLPRIGGVLFVLFDGERSFSQDILWALLDSCKTCVNRVKSALFHEHTRNDVNTRDFNLPDLGIIHTIFLGSDQEFHYDSAAQSSPSKPRDLCSHALSDSLPQTNRHIDTFLLALWKIIPGLIMRSRFTPAQRLKVACFLCGE